MTFRDGLKLTGYPAPVKQPDRAENTAQVYEHALGFLDKICEECRTRQVPLRDRLDARCLLRCVTRRQAADWPVAGWPEPVRQAFLRFRAGLGPEDDEDQDGPDDTGGVRPVAPLDALAERLLLDRAYLARVERLLEAKGQVIFYGPPGTGKTYVARELARTVTGSTDQVGLVQFHPSYAYEDFVEGYRPRSENGQPSFALAAGPLRRMAQRARQNPGERHALVIDEINRGNIAKIFGELYYLLEYRDEAIALQVLGRAVQPAPQSLDHWHDERGRPIDCSDRFGAPPPLLLRPVLPR